MPSELTFDATESFRKKLLSRKLPPYNDAFKPTEYYSNDFSNIDPGNIEEIGNIEESKLYVKNKYGPEGVNGFGDIININNDKGTETNKGEFNYYASEPSISTEESQLRASIKNQYIPEDGYTKLISIKDIEKIIEQRSNYYSFISSVYNPYNILTELIPIGNNGPITQDSDLAKIGANQLKEQFGYRLGDELRQQTVGRINALDALNDPFDALAIATGNRSIIEKDYHISVPANIIGKGLDFLSRLSGVYSPYSWIQGDYFSPEILQTSEQQASNQEGEYSDRGSIKTQTNRQASDLMLKSTGKGQSGRLFSNLSYNKLRPDYQQVNDKAPVGSYYLGSKILTVQDIISPSDALPINNSGVKVETPIYGYSALGNEYENKEASNNFKFGLNGNNLFTGTQVYSNNSFDTNRLQGGFTWVTEGSSDTAKKSPTRGGGVNSNVQTQGGVTDLLNSLSSYGSESTIDNGYDSTPKSNSYTFTKGSILDNTQRLIKAAENLNGDKKLQHVGNAISQVSKVFNDGTREMTKGSMVYKYEDLSNGSIVGTEYCRVFSKDRTYSHNKFLQKTEGAVDHNRRFKNSIFNNTYNLNIAPWRDETSSNIQEGEVKKYMFSIENLAWRTSSKKGYTYQDLPVCERGPNKGRIMWFPPYDLKVSEQNSVNWTSNEFLGRPEPIFTYNNTVRNGSLSWKIIVDHPSILNVIVDKELKNESNKSKINDIVDSFFAGCRTYDMYELATKFPQFSPSDIYEIIEKTDNVKEYYEYTKEIPRVDIIEKEPIIEEYVNKVDPSDYSYFFYFDNDVPGPKNAGISEPTPDYQKHLNEYIGSLERYKKYCKPEYEEPIVNFFETFIKNIETKTIELTNKIKTALDEGATVNVVMYGSASAPNSVDYNATLSQRRLKSVEQYFYTFIDKEKYADKFTITFVAQGEQADVYTPDGNGPFKCTESLGGLPDSTYSPTAMACRRVRIDVEEKPTPEIERREIPQFEEVTTIDNVTVTGYNETQVTTNTTEQRTDVAKRILRKLLSECDYFSMMKEDSPMVYKGIQEKIKYFQPAFHSMTPEGLNSRLTFLQQCIRPGDTIPVIGPDGKPKEGGVQNTAFGAPPICILRIGDFYHTKIAINQMSINFDPLQFDLNPEGIGVQPMIADINMSFYFIGGQGLQEPVSRLQNALSFNYYANTEMYDDRAVPTENRSEIDEEVMRRVEDVQGFSVADGKIERPEEANDTIGEILNTTLVGNNLTGETKYSEIVKELVSKSETYVQNTISTVETINNDNSLIGLYYFTNSRKYFYGLITGELDNNDVLEINIFGKPENIQNLTDTLYDNLTNDISENTNPFLVKLNQNDFKESDKKKFKRNLQNYIDESILKFNTDLSSHMSDLVKNQLSLIRTIDKINLITTETDGFKNKSGNNIILELTGTTKVDPSSSQSNTLDELLSDVQTVGYDLQFFYNRLFGVDNSSLLIDNKDLYSEFLEGNFNTEPQTRFCTIAYKDILKEPENFIKKILGDELLLKPEWVTYVNKIIYGVPEIPDINLDLPLILGSETQTNTPLFEGIKGLRDVYSDLRNKGIKEVKSFKNNDNVKKFSLYQPFNLDKERIFNYVQPPVTSVNSTKNNYFNITYKGVNSESNKFNQKYTFN